MNYSREAKDILKNWINENESNPYASESQKIELAKQTSLTVKQITTWLINERFKKSKNSTF